MDIKEKQARWAKEKPLFEAEFIHSHLLPFFNFNENTGDYEIKSEYVNKTDDEDRKVAYETLNTGWVMWLRAKRDAKAQAVLKSPVMAFDEWFKKRHEKSSLYEEALCGKDDATYIKHEMNKAFQAGWKEKQVPESNALLSASLDAIQKLGSGDFVLVRKKDFESLGEFKDLYKRAIINAKKRKNQINWAHVAGLGVGSGRAVDLCKSLGIDPGATNMHVVIETQEQSHD